MENRQAAEPHTQKVDHQQLLNHLMSHSVRIRMKAYKTTSLFKDVLKIFVQMSTLEDVHLFLTFFDKNMFQNGW